MTDKDFRDKIKVKVDEIVLDQAALPSSFAFILGEVRRSLPKEELQAFEGDLFRVVDQRLQSLRKAGKIATRRFNGKPMWVRS